jgi:hypothetical protein
MIAELCLKTNSHPTTFRCSWCSLRNPDSAGCTPHHVRRQPEILLPCQTQVPTIDCTVTMNVRARYLGFGGDHVLHRLWR